MSGGPILVVDDDPKIVRLVSTYLEREGFPVATAADGKSALTAFAKAMPRLIVLDIMLQELDGLALMRILRERSEVPIILLSATCFGQGVGPLVVGALNDVLKADFGAQAVRYSLLLTAVTTMLGALLFIVAARSIRGDIKRAA